jgi:hypothetical protein
LPHRADRVKMRRWGVGDPHTAIASEVLVGPATVDTVTLQERRRS